MSSSTFVAVIGAGPYGLSIASHLGAQGIPYRVFGKPMNTWTSEMPAGMELKSDGFATSLYDPRREFTFGHYCQAKGIPYADLGIPPKIEHFADYGREFQRRFVPDLDMRTVTQLTRDGDGFRLAFDSGPDCVAQNVVVAVGITHFATMPAVFAGAPPDRVMHTSAVPVPAVYRGQKVAVVGSGSSASDMAGLLHEQGVETHIIARGSGVPFHNKMRLPRTLYDRLRWPSSVMGPSWRSLALAKLPGLFRLLPDERRLAIAKGYLGPAGGYFMRDKVIGRVTIHLGVAPISYAVEPDGITLTLANNGGDQRTLKFDRVVCGTGYHAELDRLSFLDKQLGCAIVQLEGEPRLSARFESSVKGLYFVGAIARNTFGPVVRFACGAEYAAPAVAKAIGYAWKAKRTTSPTAQGSAERAEPKQPANVKAA